MATVYLAEDLRHDRRVAVKVLRPELAVVIGAERFLAEIRTTANLQHPHILPLFDSGEADSFLVYVMPYVEGISLRDRMTRKKQLPIGEATRIASEIASALDYAHRHGVIHRDIKPENIMLHDGADWSYRGQDIYSFSRDQGSYEVTGSFGDAAAEMAPCPATRFGSELSGREGPLLLFPSPCT